MIADDAIITRHADADDIVFLLTASLSIHGRSRTRSPPTLLQHDVDHGQHFVSGPLRKKLVSFCLLASRAFP